LAVVAAVMATAPGAHAFCGFYVGGAEEKLFNNATQVVLMRDGVRTVLSMQNNYQGPPSDFAMVVPVPVVLQKENVKTLPKAVFERVDQIASPRLVEYWEQDPCPPPESPKRRGMPMPMASMAPKGAAMEGAGSPAVKIEAQFVVGEYEIVILSARDATALDAWLRQNKYNIPAGAEPYLRPYVQQGMKFFVAKVDASKVTFQNGQAQLSPLRFHYDTEQFHLPIRLGLINSSGSQDLIVNILARNQRYDVANYENVAIPTNIDVSDATRTQFAGFYTKVFEDTLKKHPRAVVTEYSWQATSCDPCPTQPLTMAELSTLGADVLPSLGGGGGGNVPPPPPGPIPRPGQAPTAGPITPGGPPPPAPPMRRPPWGGGWGGGSDFVLTRLHVRYDKSALGDDLFFRAAAPIVGGREFVTDGKRLEQGAVPSGSNNFQARYAIRHPWTGPIKCAHPQRGIWGGPPGGGMSPNRPLPAANLGLVKSGNVQLAALVKGTLPPETFLSSAGATPALLVPPSPDSEGGGGEAQDAGADAGSAALPIEAGAMPPAEPPKGGGCAGCSTTGSGAEGAAGSGLLALVFALARRTRRRRSGGVTGAN
jgi:MYXO-CTERM domain-containing protein